MQTRSIVLLVVLAVGGAFALAVAGCAGLFYLAVGDTETSISPRIEALFAAIATEDDKACYNRDFMPAYQAATSLEKHEQICGLIRQRLGRLQSKQLTSAKLHQNNTVSTADVVYSANFEKSTATITARLQKSAGAWHFLAFRVDSNAFLVDLTEAKCPHCGAAHAASARFCPNCGKPVELQESTPPRDNVPVDEAPEADLPAE